MSGSSAVEIDFFRLNAESSASKKLSDRRDIQGVISKINPELLKTAIASASANKSFMSNKSTCSSPHQSETLPVFNQDCSSANMSRSCGAPLTIFYNGTVSVFDVSPIQVENIMKLAESGSSGSSMAVVEPTVVKPTLSNQNPAVGGGLKKDLPMSRKKSLRRFLEKRKERQVSVSPYAYSQGNASLH